LTIEYRWFAGKGPAVKTFAEYRNFKVLAKNQPGQRTFGFEKVAEGHSKTQKPVEAA
jgi:hypothetical protein